MKRFMVEIPDGFDREDLTAILYLGTTSDETPGELMSLRSEVSSEIPEVSPRADGGRRMTNAQRDKLWEMCGNYNVPFREDDYRPSFGYVNRENVMYEGWIGGQDVTIFVGVEPNGRSHT